MSKRSSQGSAKKTQRKKPCIRRDTSVDHVRKVTLQAFQYADKNQALELWKNTLQDSGWEQDEEVVEAALEAGVSCRDMSTPLWEDQDFVTEVFLNEKIDRRDLWSKIKEEWKEHPSIAFKALNARVMAFDDLPSSVRQKHVVLDALKNKRCLWSDLSEDYQRDADFAIACLSRRVLPKVLRVATDKDALWEEVFRRREEIAMLVSPLCLTPRLVPPSVSKSQDRILTLVRIFPHAAQCGHESIFDQQFMRKLMETCPQVLQNLPSWREDNPLKDMVWNEEFLQMYVKKMNTMTPLRDFIPRSRWNNAAFAKTWVRLGGPIVSDMPEAVRTEELFLLYARLHPEFHVQHEKCFFVMPDKLRKSMRLCSELQDHTNSDNFLMVFDTEIRDNWKVALKAHALASVIFVVDDYESFRSSIEAHLDIFQKFFQTILCGRTRESCPSSALDEGTIRMIASFLFQPSGPHFFQAARNLGYETFHPYVMEHSIKFH